MLINHLVLFLFSTSLKILSFFVKRFCIQTFQSNM
nr:MAG TPA: hypothetical protein [Caudoviricetes sp.]